MRLNIAGNDPDSLLTAIHGAVSNVWLIADATELHATLHSLAATTDPEPRTLDFIGHAFGDERLLRVAGLLIDARRPDVVSAFVALRTSGVLARLGVTALRLIGCGTATTAAGRGTICELARSVGLPVFGTTQLIFPLHFAAEGLKPRYEHLLVSDESLRAA